MEKNNGFDGIWENGAFKIKIKGRAYVSFYNNSRYGKGTIIFDNEKFVLTSSHARSIIFWTPFGEPTKPSSSVCIMRWKYKAWAVRGMSIKASAPTTFSENERRCLDTTLPSLYCQKSFRHIVNQIPAATTKVEIVNASKNCLCAVFPYSQSFRNIVQRQKPCASLAL